jgi:hypothetical protein
MGRLQEFDIRSRAIATLVDDWKRQEAIVRTIWTLEDLLELAIQAADSANELDQEFGQAGPTFRSGEECDRASDALEYYVAGLRKLGSSVTAIDAWVGLFESQGYKLDNTRAFRRSCSTISELTAKNEAALEAAWNELDRQALSTDEILEITADAQTSSQTST